MQQFKERYLDTQTYANYATVEWDFAEMFYWFSNLDRNSISKEIKLLPYKQFTNCLYWNIIATFIKKMKENKCEECGSQQKIHVHHHDYSILGAEFYNLHKLKVLCSECHGKKHGIRRDK